MFERGRKDEEMGVGSDEASNAGVPRSQPSSASRHSGSGGGTAVIGQSIQINGDLRGDEDLRIEGDVSGTVQLKNSNLTIGREGKVRADVYAKSIIVDGTTEGDLYATERVSVHVNAQVRGNITAPKVGIEEGAKFKGSIEMDQSAVDKALNKADMQANSGRTTAESPDRSADKSTAAKPASTKFVKEAAAGSGASAGVK